MVIALFSFGDGFRHRGVDGHRHFALQAPGDFSGDARLYGPRIHLRSNIARPTHRPHERMHKNRRRDQSRRRERGPQERPDQLFIPARLENLVGYERDPPRQFFLAQCRHRVQRHPEPGQFVLAIGTCSNVALGFLPPAGVQFTQRVRLPIRPAIFQLATHNSFPPCGPPRGSASGRPKPARLCETPPEPALP